MLKLTRTWPSFPSAAKERIAARLVQKLGPLSQATTTTCRHLASVSSTISKNAQFSNQCFKYPPHFLTKHLGGKRITTLIKEEDDTSSSSSTRKQSLGCPSRVDVAIFGGGIVGASVAYFLKENAPTGLNVAVFERDPSYQHSATTLSLGGIRQQWQHSENILMSMFTSDFLQSVHRNLAIPNESSTVPNIRFRQAGYLLLADETQAERMIDNHKLQLELGASVELLSVDRIREKFPHINTEGILLGSLGVRNEGWFDPHALLQALKAKTVHLGGHFVHGEVADFALRKCSNNAGQVLDKCNHVVVREPDGELKQVEFGIGVVCAGVDSIAIAHKLGYGARKDGVRGNELPVEARKRFAFVVNCPQGPEPNFPFMLDNTGAYCRPEGTTPGRYIMGKSPSIDEEPDPSNLEVDYSYFEQTIVPLLAQRIPAFGTNSLQLERAWAGYYDYNPLDHNPIIGQDPYYSNMIWATGFTGRGLQMGPAVGRAIMELILHDEYKTIDLSQYSWDRFFDNRILTQDIII